MKFSHWLAVGIALLLSITYALVNRYEFQNTDGAGYLCFDRWTGSVQLIKPANVR